MIILPLCITTIRKNKLINKYFIKNERSDRHGNDNATVSDTEPQGRRDTHKEEEQRENSMP